MANFVLIYAAFVALANLQANNLTLSGPKEWLNYKKEFSKVYQDEQVDQLRRTIFTWNKHRVDTFNANSTSFRLALNGFSDLTATERNQLNGFRPTKTQIHNEKQAQRFLNQILNDDSDPIPESVDWTESPGRVSQVKNQGLCGSCWAFAAVGALEGQELVRNVSIESLVELSEQNLLDCVTKDTGCDGGHFGDAFDYVRDASGVESELKYPYEMKQGKCRFQKELAVIANKGQATLPMGDEESLKKVVAKYGPVAVSISAGDKLFDYNAGVYVDKCANSRESLVHSMLLVGYGRDDEGGDFWKVVSNINCQLACNLHHLTDILQLRTQKNSWGEFWGENGYIRWARNRNNQCGIATLATIPTF